MWLTLLPLSQYCCLHLHEPHQEVQLLSLREGKTCGLLGVAWCLASLPFTPWVAGKGCWLSARPAERARTVIVQLPPAGWPRFCAFSQQSPSCATVSSPEHLLQHRSETRHLRWMRPGEDARSSGKGDHHISGKWYL